MVGRVGIEPTCNQLTFQPRIRRRVYPPVNKCIYCSKETNNPRFCTRSCSASYSNQLAPKRQKTKECKVCKTLIVASKTFCSKDCYSIGRSKKVRSIHSKSNYAHVKSFRKKIKKLAVEYKGGKCEKCGYSKCITALEFHHLDPGVKDFSTSGVSKSFDVIRLELDKCIMLCANCHREEHEALTN